MHRAGAQTGAKFKRALLADSSAIEENPESIPCQIEA